MFERAKYKDENADWTKIKNPVATKKLDGAMFWISVDQEGVLHYFSRRQSVQGHFPERTEKLPQLSSKKMPEYAGHVFAAELIHTGKTKSGKENHGQLSGILNSLPPRALATQKEVGPIRAVLHDVINPPLSTYKDKLLHMKGFEKAYGSPDLLSVVEPHITPASIVNLINKTKRENDEGVIVTSLTEPESNNPRLKVKHYLTYTLRVKDLTQEYDIHGKPKNSMGAVSVTDASGRVVGYVGSGWTKKQREEYWENPSLIKDKLIQVKTVGMARNALRHPWMNGEPDNNVPDLIP